MKCPNCGQDMVWVTSRGSLTNQNWDEWPHVCYNCLWYHVDSVTKFLVLRMQNFLSILYEKKLKVK